MSATTQGGTPAPTDAGSSMDTAETAIGRILAREGQPGRPTDRGQAPRQAPAPRGQEAAPQEAEPEAEAEPDEALPEEGEPEPDDAGEEEADAEGEDSEDGSPKPRFFTVKLPDGKTEQVPEEELVRGYQRTRDYTQKTMVLAEARKALEQHYEAVRTERQQYAQLLPALVEQYKQLAAPEIDWERLYHDNPAEYVRQQAIRRDLQDRQNAAAEEQQRLYAISQREAQEERHRLLQTERQAVGELVPAWRDEAAWNKARLAARNYAADLGYSDADIATVTDHRAVMILWQAAQYAAMAKQGRPVPQPQQTRQATAPDPGPHPLRRRVSEQTRAKQRLAQTHSVRDAAAVIRGLL